MCMPLAFGSPNAIVIIIIIMRMLTLSDEKRPNWPCSSIVCFDRYILYYFIIISRLFIMIKSILLPSAICSRPNKAKYIYYIIYVLCRLSKSKHISGYHISGITQRMYTYQQNSIKTFWYTMVGCHKRFSLHSNASQVANKFIEWNEMDFFFSVLFYFSAFWMRMNYFV